jgi:hypothetical protein
MAHGLTLSAGKNLGTTAAGLAGGWRRRVSAGPRRRFWQHQNRPEWRHFIPALTPAQREWPVVIHSPTRLVPLARLGFVLRDHLLAQRSQKQTRKQIQPEPVRRRRRSISPKGLRGPRTGFARAVWAFCGQVDAEQPNFWIPRHPARGVHVMRNGLAVRRGNLDDSGGCESNGTEARHPNSILMRFSRWQRRHGRGFWEQGNQARSRTSFHDPLPDQRGLDDGRGEFWWIDPQ